MSWRWNVANGSALTSGLNVRRSVTNSTVTLRSQLGHDLLKVDQRPREAVHRRNPQRVPATHVPQRLTQAGAFSARLARLVVTEHFIHRTQRL